MMMMMMMMIIVIVVVVVVICKGITTEITKLESSVVIAMQNLSACFIVKLFAISGQVGVQKIVINFCSLKMQRTSHE